MALGASPAGHAAEGTAEGWLRAGFVSVRRPVGTCVSLQARQYVCSMYGCVCLGSPRHKSTALRARFKNENISQV